MEYFDPFILFMQGLFLVEKAKRVKEYHSSSGSKAICRNKHDVYEYWIILLKIHSGL